MSVEFFLDTNLFVYLFDDTDTRKQNIAGDLIRAHLDADSACISHQVVQETLNVLSRKLGATQNQSKAMLDQVLLPFWRVYPSPAMYRRGLDIQERYGYSFYDSLIIAAAQEAGCRILLSEDLQDGQQIGDLLIHNPFAST